MDRLGLTHAQLRDYETTLRSSHDINVEVALRNLDGKLRGTARLLDGEVSGDRRGFGDRNGPQRRATLTLFDPNNALGVDTADPDAGSLYYDRLVTVTYSVRVPGSGWVDCDVFTGPPWKLQRDDAQVYVEADDASVLAWGETWRPRTLRKGMKKVNAIKEILSSRAGFTRFRLPDRKARLAHPVSLGRMQHPWAIAARIAASMELQLYVDGSGVVVARRLPERPLWTFNPGGLNRHDDGEVVDPLAVSTDRERFANVVVVQGRKPKGQKKRVRAVAYAPKGHPHSPWELARDNGDVPYFKVEKIRNDHFRTDAECKRKAERVLADRLRARTELTCSILPWPHLEPGDMARFLTSGGEPTVDRVDSFLLPLGVDRPMTIGWTARPSVKAREIRR